MPIRAGPPKPTRRKRLRNSSLHTHTHLWPKALTMRQYHAKPTQYETRATDIATCYLAWHRWVGPFKSMCRGSQHPPTWMRSRVLIDVIVRHLAVLRSTANHTNCHPKRRACFCNDGWQNAYSEPMAGLWLCVLCCALHTIWLAASRHPPLSFQS